MRETKKDREYHKIMANKPKRKQNKSAEDLDFEESMKKDYIFRGKLKPWYKSKHKCEKRKVRYRKRLTIKEQLEDR